MHKAGASVQSLNTSPGKRHELAFGRTSEADYQKRSVTKTSEFVVQYGSSSHKVCLSKSLHGPRHNPWMGVFLSLLIVYKTKDPQTLLGIIFGSDYTFREFKKRQARGRSESRSSSVRDPELNEHPDDNKHKGYGSWPRWMNWHKKKRSLAQP